MTHEAEALAALLPPLLAEARIIAASVATGVHGRLRAGSGDSFWQYRPLSPGESTARIDWRQSARGERLFVRETEWEAAQTVCVWRDRSASMRWRSSPDLPEKVARAELVLLALSVLLLRGAEHLSLLDDQGARHRFAGSGAAEQLARQLLAQHVRSKTSDAPSLPDPVQLPRHARLVLIGDFLSPLDDIRALLSRLSALPVSPLLVQLLDPAEIALPYDGRVRFEGLEGEAPVLVAQASELRGDYAAALSAHRDGLASLCTSAGATLLSHRTDQRPEVLLLALHRALSPSRGGRS